MADTNLFDVKITFVMAEITFKVDTVAKITFAATEITFKVTVISSLVAKITL